MCPIVNNYQAHDGPIRDYLRFLFPEIQSLDYYGLIFGSRGSIHCVTLNLLKDVFKFSDLRLGAIIDKIISESLNIYSLFHSDIAHLPDRSQPQNWPSRDSIVFILLYFWLLLSIIFTLYLFTYLLFFLSFTFCLFWFGFPLFIYFLILFLFYHVSPILG